MAAFKLDEIQKYAMHPNVFAAFKGIAIDNARMKLEVAGVSDLTDSSTGTPAAAFVDSAIPTVAFDATSAGGATTTAVNTALGKIENAGKVLVNTLNNARARVGLPLLASATGTQASANTIPALDLTVASTSGTSAVDFASSKAAMAMAKNNVAQLIAGFNELRVALGEPEVSAAAVRGRFTNLSLGDIPTVTSALTPGSSSVAATAFNTFLGSLANNLATIAQYWNYMFDQGAFTSITDSSGGTAALGLVANVYPAAANGAATTSAPKAGFDTQLNIIENAISEIATKMNQVREYYDLTPYTDSTAQTANGTVESMSVSLSAVDGSSGTIAVDVVSALSDMHIIDAALSSLAVGINDLVGFVGVPSLTDALAGTHSTTLANIPATSTGVGGVSGTPTLLNADVNTWLSINRNNISSLVATLNAVLSNSNSAIKPLSVVVA